MIYPGSLRSTQGWRIGSLTWGQLPVAPGLWYPPYESNVAPSPYQEDALTDELGGHVGCVEVNRTLLPCL